jgi:secreted trypsin-like serine protease
LNISVAFPRRIGSNQLFGMATMPIGLSTHGRYSLARILILLIVNHLNQAHLLINFTYSSTKCGGSLIDNKTIVSAGHCFRNPSFGQLEHVQVILGDYNSKIEEAELVLNMTADYIEVFPQFDPTVKPFPHDIAKIYLPAINFDRHSKLGAICLPEGSNTNYTAYNATTTGWGLKATKWGSGEGWPTAILQEIDDLEIITHNTCSADLKDYGLIPPDTSICAKSNISRICSGDSGGPLSVQRTASPDQRELIGIVSGGWKKCFEKGIPDIYTDVTNYIDWIKDGKVNVFCGALTPIHSACGQPWLGGGGRMAGGRSGDLPSHLLLNTSLPR